MSAEKPPEKPTVEIPKVPDWAIALTEKVTQGFAKVEERFDRIEPTVETLVEDSKTSNLRMTRLEVRMDQQEERAKTQSLRVRGVSETDLKHDAAIADILTKVEAIAAKPDAADVVIAEMKEMAKRPAVQKLGAALVPVLLTAIGLLGLKLQQQVTKLEEKPVVVQPVQPAPTVYVTVPADGGAK